MVAVEMRARTSVDGPLKPRRESLRGRRPQGLGLEFSVRLRFEFGFEFKVKLTFEFEYGFGRVEAVFDEMIMNNT